jgi:uncharacterized protein
MATQQNGRGQTALITGASGGIGLELARQFAAGGYNLVLVARSADALDKAAAALSQEFHIKVAPIASDLSRPNAVGELVQAIAQRDIKIDVVVNNAGYGIARAFADSDGNDQVGMVDVNIRALVDLTHRYWPDIMKSRRGGVLNVGSTAAFQPGPFMAVYCASKAFVLSFTEALWEEARGSGVRVSCLCPGATETAFHRRAGTGALPFMRAGVMSAVDVAVRGYRAFQANKRVEVTGMQNVVLTYLTAFSPRPLVLWVARRLLTA